MSLVILDFLTDGLEVFSPDLSFLVDRGFSFRFGCAWTEDLLPGGLRCLIPTGGLVGGRRVGGLSGCNMA